MFLSEELLSIDLGDRRNTSSQYRGSCIAQTEAAGPSQRDELRGEVCCRHHGFAPIPYAGFYRQHLAVTD